MNIVSGIVAIATLAALVYCGHNPVCAAQMATMERVAMVILGIVGGLAIQSRPPGPPPVVAPAKS